MGDFHRERCKTAVVPRKILRCYISVSELLSDISILMVLMFTLGIVTAVIRLNHKFIRVQIKEQH